MDLELHFVSNHLLYLCQTFKYSVNEALKYILYLNNSSLSLYNSVTTHSNVLNFLYSSKPVEIKFPEKF